MPPRLPLADPDTSPQNAVRPPLEYSALMARVLLPLLWVLALGLPTCAQDSSAEGEQAKRIEELIERLGDPSAFVRDSAAGDLGKIGPAAVPALVEALAGPDEDVRRSVELWTRLAEVDPGEFCDASIRRAAGEWGAVAGAAPLVESTIDGLREGHCA